MSYVLVRVRCGCRLVQPLRVPVSKSVEEQVALQLEAMAAAGASGGSDLQLYSLFGSVRSVAQQRCCDLLAELRKAIHIGVRPLLFLYSSLPLFLQLYVQRTYSCSCVNLVHYSCVDPPSAVDS